MHALLSQNVFLVKEQVGMFKASNNFDIYDPKGGKKILECREPRLGGITKLLRFTKYKKNTPFDVHVRTPEGEPVVRITRGVSLFLSKVKVFDDAENHVGGFKQKLFSIGGAFRVLDAKDQEQCLLQGKWTGWEFRFLRGNTELAKVSKKWAGIGKELFTSADNYVLAIDDKVEPDDPVRQLILSAVLCIDMVLKE